MINTKKLENRQFSRITLADLRDEPRWVAWQTEGRKIAYGVGQRWASSTKPADWMDWANAVGMAAVLPAGRRTAGGGGIGVVLGALGEGWGGLTLCGLDLDSCVGESGIADWAVAVLEAVGPAYVELSPSGTGLKVFLLLAPADIEAVRALWHIDPYAHGRKLVRRVAGDGGGEAGGGGHPEGVEFYYARRWFAVTGDAVQLALVPLGLLTADVCTGVVRALSRWGMDPRRAAGGGVRGSEDERLTADELAAIDNPLRADEMALWTGLLADSASVVSRALSALEAASPSVRDRSATALKIGGYLRGRGVPRDAVFKMLRLAGIGDWFDDKARLNEGRELMRLWNAAAGRDPLAKVSPALLGPLPPTQCRLPPALGGERNRSDKGGVKSVGAAAVVDVGQKPIVQVRVGIDKVVDDAEAVIEACEVDIYQRGGRLVRPFAIEMDTWGGQKTLAPGFDTLTTHSAIDVLARTADWARWDAREKALVPTNPTEMIANIWLSRKGSWRARRIKGIITAPTIRPDGSLITAPGYDPVTRLFMVLDPLLVMPGDGRWNGDRLVKADAEQALTVLEGLLIDFPFVGEADKSVALSGMMMPVIKGALDKRPLHVFDAPNPGTGKTYLVEICTALALGQAAPVSSWSKEENENEKRLATMLLSGTPVGVLDNINGVLESDLLCQALDQSNIRVRVFGKLEQRDVENNICLYATGNNIVISGDLVRRALQSKLDAMMERPETRQFHALPLQLVQQNRGKYLAAVLTVVRAHIQAGYPGCEGMRPMASFDEWGKLVRGALRWLGRADPVDTAERTFREDPKRSDLADFVEAWTRRYGYEEKSIREALDMLNQVGGDNRPLPETYFSKFGEVMTPAEVVSAFRDVALRIAGKNDIVDARVLGNWLKRNKGGVINYHRFVVGNADGHAKTQRWKVERVTSHLKPLSERVK